MLKREPFKQIHFWVSRLEEILSHGLVKRKRQACTLHRTLCEQINQHTGKIVLLMLLVLMIGTVGVMVKRQQVAPGQEKTAGEQLLHHTKEIGSVLAQPILSCIDQRLDLQSWEKQLAQIVQQDSLSSKDSTFLLQLNLYLSSDSLFQGYHESIDPIP